MVMDDCMEQIAQLAKEGRWADAYVCFCEHQQAYPARKRRLLKTVLAQHAHGQSPWRGPLLLLIFTLLFQLCTGGFFQNQLQDLFSFLGRSFRPYAYVASAIPLLIGIALNVGLIFQCYERLILSNRLFRLPIPWKQTIALFAASIALVGFTVWKAVPLAQDLPYVVDGNYPVGVVTREAFDRTLYNNALVKMGREPEEEYDPISWYTHPRWPDYLMAVAPGLYNRWVCDIHVDDVVCRMGQLQFDMTDYDEQVFPINVAYLPNSKLVLWIWCGEGDG